MCSWKQRSAPPTPFVTIAPPPKDLFQQLYAKSEDFLSEVLSD